MERNGWKDCGAIKEGMKWIWLLYSCHIMASNTTINNESIIEDVGVGTYSFQYFNGALIID
jgi:hypothetical protein